MRYSETLSETNEPRRTRWFVGLGWPFAALAALLVFELTASDPLSAVAFCSKLGWEDWLTAVWLFRRDPRRFRAIVCACFFTASGLWKMTVSSFAAMLLIILFHVRQGAPAQPPDAFIAVVLSLFISFGVSSLLILAASWLAFKSEMKAWTEWRVHRARRDDAWPPTAYCRTNHAGFLLLTSFVAVGTPLMLAAILTLAAWLAAWAKGHPRIMEAICMTAPLIGIASLTVAVFAFGGMVGRHVIAETPMDCWGESLDELIEDDPEGDQAAARFGAS